MSASSRRSELHRRSMWLLWLTVAWNVAEALVAVGAGLIAGSTALVAFGFDSTIETASATAVLWRMYRVGPDANRRRRRGAERRALRLVAITFALLGSYVLYGSVATLSQRAPPEDSTVGLVLAAASLLVMPVLAFLKGRAGREYGSRALQADSVETWVCVWLSFTLLAAVGLNRLFGWWWADPIGALAMLPVIGWQGWNAWRESRE